MLHIAHLVERRFGAARGSRIVARLLLASLFLLALGLGMALLSTARAQETAPDASALANALLDHLDAGGHMNE